MEKREVGRDGVARLTWETFYKRPYLWTPVRFLAWEGGDAILTHSYVTVRQGDVAETFETYDVETAISMLQVRKRTDHRLAV